MTLKFVQGDLVKLAQAGEFDFIYHGCNCFHTMNSGIAKQLRTAWPSVYEVDRTTPYGIRAKLGTSSSVVGDCTKTNRNPRGRVVLVNVYTQFTYSRTQPVFEHEAFELFLENEVKAFSSNNKQKLQVGFPMIGCGLAKGNPTRILAALERFAAAVSDRAETTVVKLRS